MRHLVTGGAGFLGHLIARRLLERGETVRVLDIWRDPKMSDEIEFVSCDIRDRDGVGRAMAGIDIVHHNVALVPLTKSGESFWDVNVGGSRIAAECAVAAGVDAFIHMSSSALYGLPEDCPITDRTPMKPVEIYGRGKLEGENEVRRICGEASLPLVSIRPRTLLGEGRLGIFQILFEWIQANRNVYVIGSGDVAFQFLHAHDLMDFYLLALDAQRPGLYNVGTDRYGTLRGALEKLIAYAGTSSRVRSLPERTSITALRILDALRLSPLAPWHYLTYHKAFAFDVAPLVEMGWRPRYSNDEMLQESYDWYCEHPGEIAEAAAASPHRKAVPQKLLGLLKRFS